MGKKGNNNRRHTVKIVKNQLVPIDFNIDGEIITLHVDTAKSNCMNIAKACTLAQPKIDELDAKRAKALDVLDFDLIESYSADYLRVLNNVLIVCFGKDGLSQVYDLLGECSNTDKLDVMLAAFNEVGAVVKDVAAKRQFKQAAGLAC
jgi:hypothetical protein